MPGCFLYRAGVKYLIFFILGVPLSLFLLEKVVILKLGEFTFFNMWNLRSFSRRVFNRSAFLGSFFKDLVTGPITNNVLTGASSINVVRPLLGGETRYVFRVVSVIPVFLIVCLLFF